MTDEELAICQLNMLNTVFFGGGMDLEQALTELGLKHKKYALIAREQEIYWIADKIDEIT